MMKIKVDIKERRAIVRAPRRLYSEDAVRIAAHVFESQAEIYHDQTGSEHVLTLVARRKDWEDLRLEALGGEFLNELLNQEQRMRVARFNRRISERIVAQALLAARGGENPAPRQEDSPELRAEAARLMAAAADEIRRTMPARIAPQGPPMRAPEPA